MNFNLNGTSFAHQQYGVFDPDSWRRSYGHPPSTSGAGSDLNGHYGVAYPDNALGLTSDLHNVNRDIDRLSSQPVAGNFFNNGVGHQVRIFFLRCLAIAQWYREQDSYPAPSYYPSDNSVAQPFVDEMSVGYNTNVQGIHYQNGYPDSSAAIPGDQNWQFSNSQDAGHHSPHSHHPYSSPSHTALLSSPQNINNSYSSSLSQFHNYRTGITPQMVR